MELAVVLLPLLTLTFGVIDSGMLLYTDAVVNGAVQDAARAVRTGQLRNATDFTAFRQKICDRLMGVLSCDKLAIDVRSFASWSAVTWPTPQYNPDGTIKNFGFQLGGASAITVVRVIYPYSVLTPGLTFTVDHLDRTATIVMLTEPFE